MLKKLQERWYLLEVDCRVSVDNVQLSALLDGGVFGVKVKTLREKVG